MRERRTKSGKRRGASIARRAPDVGEQEMQKSSTALLIASASLGMSGISAADLPRCDKSVRLTHWGDPMYPPTHLPDGTVVVEFTVDVQGKVSGPKILES